MNYRIIGALLVVLSSSAVGFSIAASQRKEANALMQLIRGLEFMSCELEYRLTALPELCRLCSSELEYSEDNIAAILEEIACRFDD